MKVIVTGRGGAGSWSVRGEQLGAAMGATVKPMATTQELKAHDVAIVVKRVPDDLLASLRASGIRWFYDIVDAYPQPACSIWTRTQCLQWLHHHLKTLNPPGGVIWPNKKMRDDSGLERGAVVYHHHRPGIKRHTVKPKITQIGYEGSAKYVEAWLRPIELECATRGIRFMLNPQHVADLDVIIAMRGGIWDGYAQRNWKSNVKLANAHGSGTPFIGASENGYQETSSGAEYWADTPRELTRALDWLETEEARRSVHAHFLANAYTVEQAAADMLCVLKS